MTAIIHQVGLCHWYNLLGPVQLPLSTTRLEVERAERTLISIASEIDGETHELELIFHFRTETANHGRQ
jgi:hypothetical protein